MPGQAEVILLGNYATVFYVNAYMLIWCILIMRKNGDNYEIMAIITIMTIMTSVFITIRTSLIL
jgi:hypothetical protein